VGHAEHPSVFNPIALDSDQWAAAAKSAGMTDIVDEETYERDHGYQYLLNVGPSKDGRMAKVYTDRLAEVGAAPGVNSR
jgi:alpha-L-fucosidase